MKTPKVSVLIPVYNTSSFLDRCLTSVICQSLKDIEIIVVNDGSTDNSKKNLKKWLKKDPRIHVINKSVNEGLLLARKTAVEVACGEYIVFLDSDDFYLNVDALKILVEYIDYKKTDILQFSIKMVDYSGNDELELAPHFNPVNIDIRTPEKILKIFHGEKRIFSWVLWNKIFKTKIVKAAYKAIRDEYVVGAEDAYALFMIAFRAKMFSSIKTPPLLAYRQGSGSSTSLGKCVLSVEKFNDFCNEINICKYIEDYLHSINASEEFYKINREIADRLLGTELDRLLKLQDSDIKEGCNILESKFSKEAIVKELRKEITKETRAKINSIRYRILRTIYFGKYKQNQDRKIKENDIKLQQIDRKKYILKIVDK